MGCKNSVKDIDLLKLKDLSYNLAKKVDKWGFRPQHIFYVERAGLLIAHEIALYFKCPFSGIYTKRTGRNIKSKIKILLRYLPRSITHLLRQIELKSNMHAVKKERDVYIESHLPAKDLNILLVDDAVDTGFSLNAVLEFLRKHGYVRDQIKTAVLTTTQKNPICKPDISLFEQIAFAFPWSYDSREYNEAWMRYDNIKSTISYYHLREENWKSE